MALYEHVFLARQDLSQSQVDDLVQQYTGIIENAGGSVSKTESWGLKSLAYRMDKNRKAYYTLLNIEAPAEAVQEVERQQRLSEEILRSLTLKVDELEEGQSAMLRKDDRNDRRGGRGGRDRGPRR
ncbi:30S ribosomal protein S6 [Notoacmeibacter sp. MSK16QG-6]|uniref:30S ribosomal protein S6 n=1 Tax=Notoacmeibacter sp. MSK16QG-6 TaxID=2957982 RepID=UPI00209F1437|nr:30S ribosomal protein S6 [Notoacmeibacter sp. MSK16QG-6]MCP1197990.1 30S ribosomal protein S6 [Notoacmeibacter sp. MSK16QG-6]